MEKCLIVESGFTGHRSEFVRHLMKFIHGSPGLHGKYVFALNEKVRGGIADLDRFGSFKTIYHTFSKKYKNSSVNSFDEWKMLSETLDTEKEIKEIIFLEIDPYLVLISSRRFRKYNLLVKGILFQPYHHFKANSGGMKHFLKKYLKNYLTQKITFALNSKIERCFILNDKATVDIMNRKVKNIFSFLPDPIDDEIPIVEERAILNILAKYRIDNNKKMLLLFGQIDDRKNLINIIDSLRLFPDDIKNGISLIVAGKINEQVKENYIQYLDRYKEELSIVYNDGFVADDEREVIFRHCDLVFMPYINFYGSSGVLGHAIRHGKKVIVSSLGLLKDITTEYNLGMAVNPLNTGSIRDAIDTLLFRNKSEQYFNRQFIHDHRPAQFSGIILKD